MLINQSRVNEIPCSRLSSPFLQDGHDADESKQSTADMTAFVSFCATLLFFSFGRKSFIEII